MALDPYVKLKIEQKVADRARAKYDRLRKKGFVSDEQVKSLRVWEKEALKKALKEAETNKKKEPPKARRGSGPWRSILREQKKTDTTTEIWKNSKGRQLYVFKTPKRKLLQFWEGYPEKRCQSVQFVDISPADMKAEYAKMIDKKKQAGFKQVSKPTRGKYVTPKTGSTKKTVKKTTQKKSKSKAARKSYSSVIAGHKPNHGRGSWSVIGTMDNSVTWELWENEKGRQCYIVQNPKHKEVMVWEGYPNKGCSVLRYSNLAPKDVKTIRKETAAQKKEQGFRQLIKPMKGKKIPAKKKEKLTLPW